VLAGRCIKTPAPYPLPFGSSVESLISLVELDDGSGVSSSQSFLHGFLLGRVFKLQPQKNGGDRNHGCIICSKFLISGSDTSKLLESIDSAFNNVALTIDFTGFSDHGAVHSIVVELSNGYRDDVSNYVCDDLCSLCLRLIVKGVNVDDLARERLTAPCSINCSRKIDSFG